MIDISKLITDKLWLAPLAGYTDQGFRRIVKDWDADILVSEMVSSDGLVRDSRKTIQYILFTESERPYGVQLFGSNALIMAKAVEFCLQFSPDFIDLNMGCPVKKVVKRGSGSALMQTPELASSIVREAVKAASGVLPVSVKFRSGWDSNSINYLDFGKLVEDAGASFVCLHPRTQKQMFSGLSNWEHITELKKALSIPVIGNGDICCPEDALRMKRETACDAMMIGRGALGRPWLFSQCKQLLQMGSYDSVLHSQLLETVIKHVDYALQHKPEHVVVREMRSHMCFYTKGMVGGAELRRRINCAESAVELKEIIQNHPQF